MTFEQLLASQRYLTATPDEQQATRELFFEKVMSISPRYRSATPEVQNTIRESIVGADYTSATPVKTAGRTLAQRMGFGEPGPVESMTGSAIGRVIDIPLKALNAPFALAGSVAEDITGSPRVGTAVDIGLGLTVAWAVPSKLRALSAARSVLRADRTTQAASRTLAAAKAAYVPDEAAVIDEALRAGLRLTSSEGSIVPNVGTRLTEEAGVTAPSMTSGGPLSPAGPTGPIRELVARLGAQKALPAASGPTVVGPSRTFADTIIETAPGSRRTPSAAEMPGAFRRGLLETGEQPTTKAIVESTPDLSPAAGPLLKRRLDLETPPLFKGQGGFTKAGLATTTAGAALGATAGAPTGDTFEEHLANALGGAVAGGLLGFGAGRIAARWGLAAEDAPRVAAATRLPPSARDVVVPDAIHAAAEAADPSPLQVPRRAITIALGKLKAEQLTPNVFGFPMRDVARGIPSLERLSDLVYQRADDARRISHDLIEKITKVYRPILKDETAVAAVNAALDGGDVSRLTSEQQSVYAGARALLGDIADTLGIPRTERITNYFPRLRDVVTAEVATSVTMGGRTIPLQGVIELVPGSSYIPKPLAEAIPTKYVPFFEKARTTESPATDLTLEPLMALAKGVGRRISLVGGKDPLTGGQIAGFLNEAREDLGRVPHELQPYVARWINDFLGHGQRGGEMLSAEVIHNIKALQFVRTIGANILSAAQNTTQTLNTFALVKPTNWLAAWGDMLKPEARAMAAKWGVRSDLGKGDLDMLMGAPLNKGISAVASWSGAAFQKSEYTARLHTFLAGMREASDLGKQGDEAVSFARSLVDKTQFHFGREGLPAPFRSAGSLGQLVQQFKTYPINQALFMKNLLVDDLKDLIKLEGRPFQRTVKFFGPMIALFGSDAVTMGLDKTISKFFTDNEDTLRVKGFFPALGIYLANQMGLGVLPVEDLRSLMFFLPGPFLSMVANSVSVATGLPSLTGLRPNPEAPYGINLELSPDFGKPLTAEQFASKASQLIPVGGVFANRIRRAVLEAQMQSTGDIRLPETLRQAFSVESMTGNERLLRRVEPGSPAGALKTMVGVQDPEVVATMERRETESDLIAARNAAVHNIAKLMVLGKQDDAYQMLQDFNTKYGTSIRVTPDAIRAAIRSARLTSEEISVRKSPRDIRSRLREIAEPTEN